MSSIDLQKVQYVALIKLEGGEAIAAYSPREPVVDPDLVAGFVTAVIIFAKTPIRTVRKAAYDILIEVGESFLILLVVDPVPDEMPFRHSLKKLLHLIESFSLDSVRLTQIREIYSYLEYDDPDWVYYHLLQQLLKTLGMSWMGFLDGDPREHLRFILSRVGYAAHRNEIFNYVRSKICEQIDAGGTTIGIDLDRMLQDGHLAARVDKVLEKRLSEIRNVEVVNDGNTVDIRNLWLTAYGFDMKLAGLSSNHRTLNRIKRELDSLGISLRVSSSPSQTNILSMSEGMRDYIWFLSSGNSGHVASLSPKLMKKIMKTIFDSEVQSIT